MSRHGRQIKRCGLCVLVALAMVLVSQPVSAETQASTMDAVLPDARYEGAAVWDGRDLPDIGCSGGCAYLVAGRDGAGQAYDDILAYNPTSDQVWVAARLPEPMKLSSVVFSGEAVYILGGFGADGAMSTVLHFDPVLSTVVPGVSLPHPVAAASTVWDSTVTQDCPTGCAYLFGGSNNEGEGGGHMELDQVLRIDPVNGTTEVVGTMPTVRSSTTAVWDPDARVAYVLGGRYLDGPTVFLDEILAFTPASGTTSLAARLPEPLAYGTAVHDGGRVLYFGGYPTHTGPSYHSDRIVAFEPSTGSTSVLDARLPTARVHAASVAAGPVAYVFGGTDGFPGLDDIVRFGPEGQGAIPPIVEGLEAVVDHASRHVELVWSILDDEDLEGFIIERDGTILATLPWGADRALRFVDEVGPGDEHCYHVLATTTDGTVAPAVPPVCIAVDAVQGDAEEDEQSQQGKEPAEETHRVDEEAQQGQESAVRVSDEPEDPVVDALLDGSAPVAAETSDPAEQADQEDDALDAASQGAASQVLGSGTEVRQVTPPEQAPLKDLPTPTASAWVTGMLLLGAVSVLRHRR